MKFHFNDVPVQYFKDLRRYICEMPKPYEIDICLLQRGFGAMDMVLRDGEQTPAIGPGLRNIQAFPHQNGEKEA